MAGRFMVWTPPAASGQSSIRLHNPTAGIRVLWDLVGFMRPPYRVTTKRYPGQAGSRLQHVVADERELSIGLWLAAATRADFVAAARGLVRRLQPLDGEGTLTVVDEDGSSRAIDCVCVDGARGEESEQMGGRTWWRLTLTMLAPQPYAYLPDVVVPWSLAPSGRRWFPIIPIRLAPSGLSGRQTVRNPGDVEVSPLIVVQGPGRQLVAANRTLGKAAHLDYEIPGEGPASVVTIDTRPNVRSITDGFGRNLFPYLTDNDPSLWTLRPGDNSVEVSLQSTGPGSSASVRFRPLVESL